MTSVKEAKLSSDPVLSPIDFAALSIDQVTGLRAAAAAEIRRRRGGKSLAKHINEVICDARSPIETAEIHAVLVKRGIPASLKGTGSALDRWKHDFNWTISKSSFPPVWTCASIGKKTARAKKVSRATRKTQ